MERLAGRIAVVTAAGGNGMGRAIAVALAANGVKVVVADIDEVGADRVVSEIKAAGGEAIAVRCDVIADDAFEVLKATALDRYGDVDIIVNNVGVLSNGRPEDLPLEEWRRIYETNLMSVIKSNIAFLPLLLAKGEGHIVNTASFAGLLTYAYDRLPYASAKAAIISISEGLALYLRPLGIGVTCLCPGPVNSGKGPSATGPQPRRPFSEGLDIRGPGSMFQVMRPDLVGEMVVRAIRENIYFLPTHPEVHELMVERARDPDAWVDKQIANPHIIRRAQAPIS